MVAAGRTLSLGYFDHPPPSWWLAETTAHLAGTEAPCVVRLPFIALFALTTWLMARLGAAMDGVRGCLGDVGVQPGAGVRRRHRHVGAARRPARPLPGCRRAVPGAGADRSTLRNAGAGGLAAGALRGARAAVQSTPPRWRSPGAGIYLADAAVRIACGCAGRSREAMDLALRCWPRLLFTPVLLWNAQPRLGVARLPGRPRRQGLRFHPVRRRSPPWPARRCSCCRGSGCR